MFGRDPTFSHIFPPFYKQRSPNFENLSENSIIRTDDMCFNSFCCISNLHVLVILNLLIICKKKYTFSFQCSEHYILMTKILSMFTIENPTSTKHDVFIITYTGLNIWNTIITTGHVYDNVTTRKLWNKNI